MTQRIFFCIAAIGMSIPAHSLGAGVQKFDFGRKDRKRVMKGFTAVTLHDASSITTWPTCQS